MARIRAGDKTRLLRAVALDLGQTLIWFVSRDRSVPASHLQAIRYIYSGKGKARVEVPFYWAAAYHNGRGAVRAKPGGWLVFWPGRFNAPFRDPRLQALGGGYPRQKSQRRRLTEEEFKEALRSAEAVIAKEVGPWPGNPYLTRAGRRLTDQALTGAANEVEIRLTAMTDRLWGPSLRQPRASARLR